MLATCFLSEGEPFGLPNTEGIQGTALQLADCHGRVRRPQRGLLISVPSAPPLSKWTPLFSVGGGQLGGGGLALYDFKRDKFI